VQVRIPEKLPIAANASNDDAGEKPGTRSSSLQDHRENYAAY